MRLWTGMVILMLALVFVVPASAAPKESTPYPAPTGSAPAAEPEGKAKEQMKKDAPPAAPAPTVTPAKPPVKILKDEGC
jgi:hypothetical protein